MAERPRQPTPGGLIWLIIGGLLAWGVYLAAGTYLDNRNLWRPLIVLACVGAFVGGWLLLLRGRKGRIDRSK